MPAAPGSANVLFLTNRNPAPTGFADTPVPGPIAWGSAALAPDTTAPEGFRFPGPEALTKLTADAFATRLRNALKPAAKRPKIALLHLHGAGVLAGDSFVRGASLAATYATAGVDVVPVMISWACGGFAVQDYVDARAWLVRDVAPLAEGFRAIARVVADARAAAPTLATSLSAHSLGNFLLGRILADCAARASTTQGAEPDGTAPPFDDTLLFAADVDETAFVDDQPPPGIALHRLGRWCRGVTVYHSHQDSIVALGWIGQSILDIPGRHGPALGSDGPEPASAHLADGTPLDTIDCSFLPSAIDGLTQHHYWRLDPSAIRDVQAVLRRTPPSGFPWRTRQLFQPGYTIFPPNTGLVTPSG